MHLDFHLYHSCFFHEQLGDLNLEDLLDTLPPGLDEAIAISKACTVIFFYFKISRLVLDYNYTVIPQVVEFLESQEYSRFRRIVFDTAPTVRNHSLLLRCWCYGSINKINFAGSHTSTVNFARFLGCISRQDDEGE